jgi:hypothetical protein
MILTKKKTRLLKTLLFIIIFLIINYFFSSLFLKERLYKSRTFKIDKQLHRVINSLEVLGLGDSHPASGFDPRVFKNGFNFSFAGEKYIYNYYKLKYVIENSKDLKIVVLPVDLHSFSTWGANVFLHDFYWIKYTNYWELGKLKKRPFRFVWKYIKGRFFPYIGEFLTVFGIKENKKKRMYRLPRTVNGLIIKRGTFFKKRDKETRIRMLIQYYKQKIFDDTVVVYFKKILKLCKDNDIKLVLVRYPVTKIYYRYALKKVNEKKYYNKIFKMIENYNNIIFIDLHSMFFKKDGSYFYDSDHMNYIGARKFTKRLKEILVKKYLYKNL